MTNLAKSSLVTFLVVLVGTILGASYAQSAQSSTASAELANPQPFSLSITTPQDTLKAGSDVHITITLKNTSSQDLSFLESYGFFPYLVDVRNAAGSAAAMTEKGRKAKQNYGMMPPFNSSFLNKVKPGQTQTADFVLNEFYDMKVPGKYFVQVERSSPISAGVVRSNRLAITLTP